MAKRQEVELYAPIKQFFEERGYTVRGEVSGCDLVAVRDEELVVVELKTAFNLALVMQGVERQKAGGDVYLAVEAPKSAGRGSRWGEITHLCRRLGLGLIAVSFTRARAVVQVIGDPDPLPPRANKQRRTLLLSEFKRRSGDFNTGGSNRRPIVTAYREEALLAAAYLKRNGSAAPKEIRQAIGVEKVAQMLQQDYYGWFERVDKGIYRLSAKGEAALERYADVVAESTDQG